MQEAARVATFSYGLQHIDKPAEAELQRLTYTSSVRTQDTV